MAEKLNVLLVENNEANANWLQSTMQEDSIKINHVKSIGALKKAASQLECDVVILSLSLPDCTGIDCIQKVKELLPDIPIVVAVPAEAEAEALASVRSGAQGFIRIKTLGSNSLAAVIHQAFERQKAVVGIRESKRELDNLVSNLPGFIYRCHNDQNWTMEYISQGCENITGYSPEEFISNRKKTFKEIIHPDDRAMVKDVIQTGIMNGEHYQLEYRIQTATGEEKWVWEQGNTLESDISPVRLQGFITDITDKKIHEFQMQSLMDIGAILRNSISYSEFSNKILEKIKDLYSVEFAAFVLITKSDENVKVESAIGSWESFTGIEVEIEGFFCYQAIIKNNIILYDDQKDHDKLCRAFRNYASQHMAFIPIASHKKKFGLIVVGRSQQFAPKDLEVFETIANMIASSFERANLYQKTEKQLKRLESLHAIDQAITSVFDINVIFKIILDQVNKELDVDAADIFILNPASNMLECAGIIGFMDRGMRYTKLPLTTSIAGKVLLENQKNFISNLDEEPLLFIRNKIQIEKFKGYFAHPLSIKGEVVGVMEIFFKKPFYPSEEWIGFFESLSTQASVAYDSYRKYTDLQRMQQNVTSSFRLTLETWSISLELHDIESHGHIRRVTDDTLKLARDYGVAEEDLLNIERGALLHDIGKIGIMDNILQKKGTLTDKEWIEIKRHPQIARDLLSNVKMLEDAMDIPYCHHENWDGSGYPQGLKGEEIPLPARIFAVVETYDALTSARPYRKAWSKQETIKYLQEEKGKKFDPAIVDRFLNSV